MTLLMALRGVDGIVVASDSRGTFGDPRAVTAQNDAQKKLYRASKHAAILTAGSGELGATVMADALTLIQETDSVSVVTRTPRDCGKARRIPPSTLRPPHSAFG
jgi:ATP-dependent protease HslVU (ClpYQ) peptidase subunit